MSQSLKKRDSLKTSEKDIEPTDIKKTSNNEILNIDTVSEKAQLIIKKEGSKSSEKDLESTAPINERPSKERESRSNSGINERPSKQRESRSNSKINERPSKQGESRSNSKINERPSKQRESRSNSRRRKSSRFSTRSFHTERIPIQAVLGDKYVPDEDIKKKKRKDKANAESVSKVKKHSIPSSSRISREEGRHWKGTQSKIINFTVIRDLKVRPNKYTANIPCRNIKMTKNMERPFLIIEDNVDHTPQRAVKPGDSGWLANPLLFSFPAETITQYKPEDLLRSYGRSSTKSKLSFEKKFAHSSKPESISDGRMVTTPATSDEDESDLSVVPSMYHLFYPEPPSIDKKRISFKLAETENIILLDIKSRASEIGDEEGLAIERDNQYQIELKKRLRKTVENFSQTSMGNKSIRMDETQVFNITRANSYGYTSNWEYYDTMIKAQEIPVVEREKTLVGKVEKIIYAEVKSFYEPLLGYNFKIVDRLNWFRTGMVMERLLVGNNARGRQLVFHDHLRPDPMSKGVDFKYSLLLLWTLKNDTTVGRTVTSMSWNPHEQNILAVGYGKYNFSDKTQGLVLIWNNKNLANPEREYSFEHPVTSVQFGKVYPAVLAIGFYSGMVMLINTIKHHGMKIVAQNIPSNRTLVHPVWQVTWMKKIKATEPKVERIIECRADGCVYKYTRNHLYEKKLIMRVSKMKGIVKGIPHSVKCQPYVIPLVRNPAILCIAMNPEDPTIYLIGSDEGVVYKCSHQDVHQHLDFFLAHNGPVYNIQFHPACSKVFLTCGADWYIRVWADGIYLPLITMISGMSAVQSALWFPNNPTIIASITSTRIELWDISRKINLPQATVTNPYGCVYTSMTFSQCGENLCVGDDGGNVFVFGFHDMPFKPVFKDMVLALALLKALIPNQKLLLELQKLGEPFNVHRIYRNLINLPF